MHVEERKGVLRPNVQAPDFDDGKAPSAYPIVARADVYIASSGGYPHSQAAYVFWDIDLHHLAAFVDPEAVPVFHDDLRKQRPQPWD